MSELKSEHEVILTSKVAYHHGGEKKQAVSVLLLAPSYKQIKETVKIKQFFFQAIASMQDAKKELEQDDSPEMEMDGEAVVSMMFMSDVDMNKVFDEAKKLLTSGVAKIDGVETLNDSMIESLSVDDFEKIVGEYLINFIIASALMKMKSLS